MLRLLFSFVFSIFSLNAHALTVTSNGADGLFQPVSSLVLDVPVDGVFNFTGIDISAGIEVDFNRAGFEDTIWLTAISDITIAGNLNWEGDFGISSLNGNIYVNSLVVPEDSTFTFEAGGMNSTISLDYLEGLAGSTVIIAANSFILGGLIPDTWILDLGSGEIAIPDRGNIIPDPGAGVIVINTVPVPPALLLFFSAMLMAGYVSRNGSRHNC